MSEFEAVPPIDVLKSADLETMKHYWKSQKMPG